MMVVRTIDPVAIANSCIGPAIMKARDSAGGIAGLANRQRSEEI
jgi:hypothetical protein